MLKIQLWLGLLGALMLVMTPAAIAQHPGSLLGDLDGDCDVDLSDLAQLLANYGQTQHRVVSWGSSTETPEECFTKIAAGACHSMGLTLDGEIVVWGCDDNGLITNAPTGNGFIDIACGNYHCLALWDPDGDGRGSVLAWGLDDQNQVSDTPTDDHFMVVGAGGKISLAIQDSDGDGRGTIVAWGDDRAGVVSNVPVGDTFIEVDGGAEHAVALRADGSIVEWGNDTPGEPPTDTNYQVVRAGHNWSLALTLDGEIVAWGVDDFGQITEAPEGSNFIKIDAGYNFGLAIEDPDGDGVGSIVAWGENSHGQVGNIPQDEHYIGIAGGSSHGLGLNP